MTPGQCYLVTYRENRGAVQFLADIGWAYLVKNKEGKEVTYSYKFNFVPMTPLLWELV
jgi:hypothetical protein